MPGRTFSTSIIVGTSASRAYRAACVAAAVSWQSTMSIRPEATAWRGTSCGSKVSAGCRSHSTVRSPDRASPRITANWFGAPSTTREPDTSTPMSVRLLRDIAPSGSAPNEPTYVVLRPSFAQAESAVAICPPGICMKRCSRCFELDAGYSATTASKSMLLSPNPATSNGLEPAFGIFSPSRTFRILSQSVRDVSHAFNVRFFFNSRRNCGTVGESLQSAGYRLDFRLSFADTFARLEEAHMLPLTKGQREILDYLNEFIQQHGYAPSLEEIGKKFGLSSLATVHKHLTNLQDKGFIKRAWNRSRSVEMVPTRTGGRAIELPLLGYVAAGVPIEAVASNETIAVPEAFVGKRDTYVLRVRGDSMIDEQIRDGDFVVVEDRKTADNGEMVIALLRGSDVTLKKLYRDPGGKIRLQPANAAMQPIFVEPDQVQIQGVVVGVMRKY